MPRKNWVALVLVAGGVGGFFLWRNSVHSGRPPVQPPTVNVSTPFQKWSSPLRADWNRAILTPITDEAALREGLAKLIHATPVPVEMDIPDAKKEALVDCLATFFFAWSSDNAKDYLFRIKDFRVPLAHAADGRAVLNVYPFLVGNPLPLDMPTTEVLQVLWVGRNDITGRPRSISLVAPNAAIDLREYNPVAGPRNFSRYGIMDEATRGRWTGPLVASLPSLTEPKITIDLVEKPHDPWVEQAFVGILVQALSGERFPLQISCYWSPKGSQWQLHNVGVITTDLVTWPY